MSRKMGGPGVLTALLLGEGDLFDICLSTTEGGLKLTSGLASRVHDTTNGTVSAELTTASRASMATLAGEIHADGTWIGMPSPAPNLVLFSLAPDIFESTPTDAFIQSASHFIQSLKNAGCHVVALNASTVDPTKVVSNYHGLDEPFTRRAQRLDLALLELSISEGISIVDADRILGEIGTKDHVNGPLDYSPTACDALANETLRILEDYGFFEARPVLEQVGRSTGEAS